MQELGQVIPDHEVLLAMQPEELGEQIVLALQRHNAGDMVTVLGIAENLFPLDPSQPGYPHQHRGFIEHAITEAFAWLEAQVLLVPASGANGQNGWRILSRRAREMRSAQNFAEFRTAQDLPRSLLHETIKTPVWLAFIRREYDTAVFQAMKAVEVSVRDAAGFSDTDIGVQLMRKAFHVDSGPLTDPETSAAEREALAHLFVGAIGSYKNPHSHRNVAMNDPGEAAEIIILASHLLKIVDDRRGRFRSD